MSKNDLNIYNSPPLDQRSLYLRGLVIRAFEGGTRGHLGSSMSLIEILRVLYDNFLNFDINIIDNVSNNVEDSLFTAERDLVGTTNEINIIELWINQGAPDD